MAGDDLIEKAARAGAVAMRGVTAHVGPRDRAFASAVLAVFEAAQTSTSDDANLNITPEGIEVKPGQQWRSLDKRDNGRTVIVELVNAGKARVTGGVTRSTLSVRRMRRTSTGWELVDGRIR